MTLTFPGDKSLAHRALLFALVARTPSRIGNVPDGDDVNRTVEAVRALGAEVLRDPIDAAVVHVRPPRTLKSPAAPIDCGNSGTLARLLMGLCAGVVDVSLVGDASLSKRPMARVQKPLEQLLGHNLVSLTSGTLPARVLSVRTKPRRPAVTTVDTDVRSAQVKSALVLAARSLEGDVTITERAATRDHTERMLAWLLARDGGRALGSVTTSRGEIRVRAPLAWDGFDVDLPGDASSAALVAAYAIAARMPFAARNVVLNETRAGFWRAVKRMGVHVELKPSDQRMGEPCGDVACARVDGAPLVRTTTAAGEAASLIDEVPALVVVAVHAGGVTRIEGVGELRHKESDRLARLVELAQAFGADATASNKGVLEVRGRMQSGPAFAKVRTDGDHRIAMAAQALARIDVCDLELDDARATDTSFPGFMRALSAVDSGAST